MVVGRRGGGGDSGSLLGRVLRAWRGSAPAVGKKGGMLGRLRRFVKALWTGKSSAEGSKGPAGAGQSGGSGRIRASGGAGKVGGGKVQGRIDKHLGKAYKRGNANFRIQKVYKGGG